MEFRVHLGHKDGMPLPRADIATGTAIFGEMLGAEVGSRRVVRLVDEKGNDKVPLLFDPVILKVTPSYMEVGGTTEDGHQQSWIMRFFPIEATKEWATLQAGGPSFTGSMAHLSATKPAEKKG